MPRRKDTDYLAISTRVHAMENKLLTRERMERMIDAKEDSDALKILEECGYHINILGLAAVGEQVSSNPYIRENYPGHAHRLFHIFRAEVVGQEEAHSNEDLWQEKSVWMPIDELSSVRVCPEVFTERIEEIVRADRTVFCGCKML